MKRNIILLIVACINSILLKAEGTNNLSYIPDGSYIGCVIDDTDAIYENIYGEKLTLNDFYMLCPHRSPVANEVAVENFVETINEGTNRITATHDWFRSNWNYHVKPEYIFVIKINKMGNFKANVFSGFYYNVTLIIMNNEKVISNIVFQNLDGDFNDVYTHRDVAKAVAKKVLKILK